MMNLNLLKQVLTIAVLVLFIACKNQKNKNNAPIKEENTFSKQSKDKTEEKTNDKEYKKILKGKKITYHLQCPNNSSLNELSIKFERKGIESEHRIDSIAGSINNSEISDLDQDGYEELLVYTTSAGSGSYGEVYVYTLENKNNESRWEPLLFFTNMGENGEPDAVKSGYRGRDIFYIEGLQLIRAFPIYLEGDANANPSGGKRKISYTFVNNKSTSKKFEYKSHVDIK